MNYLIWEELSSITARKSRQYAAGQMDRNLMIAPMLFLTSKQTLLGRFTEAQSDI